MLVFNIGNCVLYCVEIKVYIHSFKVLTFGHFPIKLIFDLFSTGGIPARDVGPINEWWVSGFDGGERALIGFSTAYGEYYLMEPSEAYAPLMESVKEKIYMGKLVIEFLLDQEDASYEDLLNKLQVIIHPFIHFFQSLKICTLSIH